MIDFERIKAAPVASDPYPYLVVEDALSGDAVASLKHDVPALTERGSYDVSGLAYGKSFAALLDDLKSDRFRALVEKKFGLDLSGKTELITFRGQMEMRDGAVHMDTPAKLVTILLYLNEGRQGEEASLRILRSSKTLDDYAAEVSPRMGSMVMFKVTNNCWHGHKSMEGKRYSIQMNYLSGRKVKGHEWFRRLPARIKRKLSRLVR